MKAIKYNNQLWSEKWADEDFDITDIDAQIADFKALIHTQANALTDAKAENSKQAEEIKKLRRIEHRIKMESGLINPNWLKVRDDIWQILKGQDYE